MQRGNAEDARQKRVGQGVGGYALPCDATLGQNDKLVAMTRGKRQIVQRDGYSRTACRLLAQKFHQAQLMRRIEIGCRLVSQKDWCRCRQGARE